MTKFRDRSPQQRRNICIAIVVVAAILLAILIPLIVYIAPVKGTKTTEHWYSAMEYTDDYAFNVQKTPGKEFKILTIADPQLADLVEVGPKGDPMAETRLLVEKTQPDLIIVMGDITWTGFTKNSVKRFVREMEEIGVPWAPIFGNHEDEKEQGYFCHVDRNWVADRFLDKNVKHCLFKKGGDNIGGVGNYVINIKEGNNIVETLIMMDSHAKRQYPEYGNGWYYDYIYDSQMVWYNWVLDGVKKLNAANKYYEEPESMIYLHIPLPEYEIAYNEYSKVKKAYDKAVADKNTIESDLLKHVVDKYGYIGKNVEGVWGSNTAGDNLIKDPDADKQKEEQYENCVNSGFFNVLKKGGTKYVFAGHDHSNNYSLLWEGVRLTYTTKTGYKCSYEPGRTGGTLIKIGDKVNMQHIYAVYDAKDKLTGLKDGEVF